MLQNNNLESLQTIIKYNFNNIKLLNLALTHPSYANENNIERFETNQRLEFLGDSVLELISSSMLYNNFPKLEEGKITKIRAKLVCEESLSKVARDLNIYEYLLLGKGENRENVKYNNSIMCDAIEAIIGAIYIDSGLNSCTTFCNNFILTEQNINKSDSDFKSLIQEYVNMNGMSLVYELEKEIGPDHSKVFYMNLIIDNEIFAKGIGKSKKEAEQDAARVAFDRIIKKQCI